MKTAAIAIVGLLTIAACDMRRAEEAGRQVDAADTIVTAEERVDTSIITRDTTVEVDTIQREGDRAVGRDTVQRGRTPTPAAPADTARPDTMQP